MIKRNFNVTSIGSSAFRACFNLKSIEISDSVTNISDHAFTFCHNIENIRLPKNITSISTGTFDNCYGLTSITIPKSVTSIGDSAFYNCHSLTDVYYTGSEEEWNNIVIDSNNSYLKNATIHFNSVAGDFNGNGEINLDDVIYSIRAIVDNSELTAYQLACVDLSGDSNFTVLDIVLMQKTILEAPEAI